MSKKRASYASSDSEVSSDNSEWSAISEDDLDATETARPNARANRSHRAQKAAAYLSFPEPWQRLAYLLEFGNRFEVVQKGDRYVIVPDEAVGENYLDNKAQLLEENGFECNFHGVWSKPVVGNEMDLETLKPLGFKYKGKNDSDPFAFDAVQSV